MDSLFEDHNDRDSHYFDETDNDSKYFQVNKIDTFFNDLTRHENLSLLHLCTSDGDKEIIKIELLTKNMKNIIVSCCYKPLDGKWKNHCDHLQKILSNATMENKLYFVTGDFNLNCLEFHQSSEIRQFLNNMFEKGAIPLINTPTRVTTSSAALIDNIFTNCVFDTSLKKGIIKTSTSDHFQIFAAIKLSNEKTKNQKLKIQKGIFSDKNKESFYRISIT